MARNFNFFEFQSDFLNSIVGDRTLIIGSKAGKGNSKVAKILAEFFGSSRTLFLESIEDLISDEFRLKHFVRHEYLAKNHPAILKFIDKSVLWQNLKGKRSSETYGKTFSKLISFIKYFEVNSLVVTNMLALSWISNLKLINLIPKDVNVIAFHTDFGLPNSFSKVNWDYVDMIFSPLDLKIKNRNIQRSVIAPIPISANFLELGNDTGGRDILICGGAWGLGNMIGVLKEIGQISKALNIHFVCGDNRNLYEKVTVLYPDSPNIFIYQSVENLHEIIKKCFLVISKPGGVTITECLAANRILMLTSGISKVEEQNKVYASQNYGAKRYSLHALQEVLGQLI